MKKYPRRIYVFRENDGTEDEFFNSQRDASVFASLDETKNIAIYELVKTAKIKAVVEYEED